MDANANISVITNKAIHAVVFLTERIAAFFLLLAVSPLLACVALLVASDGGPTFSRRRSFYSKETSAELIVFRTMFVGERQLLEEYLSHNPDAKAEFIKSGKLAFDPRITSVGKIINRFHMQRLVHPINVLRGAASLAQLRQKPSPERTLDELDNHKPLATLSEFSGNDLTNSSELRCIGEPSDPADGSIGGDGFGRLPHFEATGSSTTSGANLPSTGSRDEDQLKMKANSVSVLMSTYRSEAASNLSASLESMYVQTVPPNQVVLVIDGPVGGDQEQVIARFAVDRRVNSLTVVRLPYNQGLASAMNAGLTHCEGIFTMRMDSDDLSTPDRVEVQLRYAAQHPDIDVVTSWAEDFFEDGSPGLVKVSPTEHHAIALALRWRNLLVHPSIMLRTEVLRRVGGYRSKHGLLEDYDLFVRLIQNGAKFHAIPKFLVRVRSSVEQRGRRGGWQYFKKELSFRWEAYRTGFLNLFELIATTVLYAILRLASNAVRRRLYTLSRA